MSTLYIVGTPIGNLGDFSPRGQETLATVDFIAAEDTRLSRRLLTHFGISTPLISYHQHNQRQRAPEIIARLQNGESCALITDAGMPAISDPGEDLVAACAAAGLAVLVVPGPTAALSALAVSGLPTRRFAFEGFLEGSKSQQRQQLLDVKETTSTLIFYEAPHKLLATLSLMLELLGDRKVALCRELTKLYEETLRMTLSEAVTYYEQQSPRGEYVLIIEGAPKEQPETHSLEEATLLVYQRSLQGVSLSTAAKEVAEITGYKKGTLYKGALDLENQ